MSFKKFNFVTRLLGTTKYFRSQELKGKKLVCRSPGSWSGWTWPDGPDPAAPGPRRCPNETLLKKNRIEIDLFQRDSDDGSLFDELDVFISFLFLLRFLFAFATSAAAACFGSLRRNFGTIFGSLPRTGSGNKMSEAALFRNFG